MRSTTFAVLSGLAALAQATTPTTQCTDSCNPVYTPGQSQIVPAGTPFNITWGPTTKGTLSIILLRGPSTNVVPLSTIVEGIANTGSYLWTPATTLQADTSRYGLQLVDDATGTFQYSNQFGISNTAAPASSGTTTSGTSTRASSTASSGSGGAAVVSSAVSATSAPSSAASNSTASAVASSLSSKISSAASVLSSATASKSSSASASGSKTSSSAIVTATGSAGERVRVGGVLGVVAAVAVLL